MKLWLALGTVVFALAIVVVISGVVNALQQTGTTDEAAHMVRVGTDGAAAAIGALFK